MNIPPIRIGTLSDDGDNEFPVADKGEYLAEIKGEPEVRATKNKEGSYYLNWSAALHDEDFAGVRVWWMTSLTSTSSFAIKKLVESLYAVGIEVKEGDMLDVNNLPPVDGKFVILELDKVVDDYRTKQKGKTVYKNTVESIRPFVSEEKPEPEEVPF